MEIFEIAFDTFEGALPYTILALGIFLTYRILDFPDLGAEGTFTLGGSICALLTINGLNPFFSLFISLLIGALAGFITGILHTKLKIPALLSGIITMTALFTINMIIMGKANDGLDFDIFKSASSQVLDGKLDNKFYYNLYDLFHNTWNISWFTPQISMVILMLVIILLVSLGVYYFYGTEIGMSIRAVGLNKEFSKAEGINTDSMTIVGLMISNSLIALSGAIVEQVTMGSSTSMGVGVLVIGLASIIIGEAIFGKKTFKNNMISVMVGSVIYYLVVAFIINAEILDSHFLKLLSAITIVIVLSISNRREKNARIKKC